MPNRKYKQRNTRKIFKKGGSFSLTIPVEMMKELGWKGKQKVKLSRTHGGILIKDWKK